MPRSAGGALPTGTPRRSRSPSPPHSPSHSRPSPRVVQSAPSRMADPLSVAKLLTPADLAATPIAMKPQRSEIVGKLHTAVSAHGSSRAPAQRGSLGLNILNKGAQRPSTQQYMAQLATNAPIASKPSLASRGHGTAADGTVLPPLECKGQGRPSDSRSRSPSYDNEARVSKLRGIRSGSPVREARADKDRLERFLVMSKSDGFKDIKDKNPVLSIGSLRPNGEAPPPTGLLPPELRHERAATAKMAAGRPATNAGRMSRQGGALSMPHLGPPRLLVQIVGAAY
jgi:hypothetical protein